MTARDRFLDEVAAALPLPDDVKQETVEELAAHLADSIAAMVADGTPPDVAEARAIARLGPPGTLASGLARAHRGRSQLLAAAGAGTWAAIRSGVVGFLLASVTLVLAWIVVTTAVRSAVGWLGLQLDVNWTGGWNTVLTAAGLNVGAFLGGAAAVRGAARSGWRGAAEVRTAVVAVGCVALGWLVLIAFETALNWASVIALLLVPVAFGVGAWIEPIRQPDVRTTRPVLLVGLVLVIVLNVGVAATSGGASSYQWNETGVGYEMIAPWWQDPAAGQAMDFVGGSSSWSVPGVREMTVEAAAPAVIARFRDFRFEAWRAESPRDDWRLLPGQTGPFATAEAAVDGAAVSGVLRFNQTPGVDWAEVALTAIGPDGRRYLLTASGPEQTQFYGSVWSWFSAWSHGNTLGR